MFDFLENFEKRMEWIGITNSIINRKGNIPNWRIYSEKMSWPI